MRILEQSVSFFSMRGVRGSGAFAASARAVISAMFLTLLTRVPRKTIPGTSRRGDSRKFTSLCNRPVSRGRYLGRTGPIRDHGTTTSERAAVMMGVTQRKRPAPRARPRRGPGMKIPRGHGTSFRADGRRRRLLGHGTVGKRDGGVRMAGPSPCFGLREFQEALPLSCEPAFAVALFSGPAARRRSRSGSPVRLASSTGLWRGPSAALGNSWTRSAGAPPSSRVRS